MNIDAYHRQFLIYSLKLPYDITNEINGYLFYDKKTAYVRNQFRKKICNEISSGFNSRNRTEYAEEQLQNEYLMVDYPNCVFSSVYCRLCGNHISYGLFDTRVWCVSCERLIVSTTNSRAMDDYTYWRYLTYRNWDYE